MKNIIILLFLTAAVFAQSEEYERNLNLGDSDTANYTVVAGDNLWDLAGRFYGDNFQWRFIWEHNRQIEDPHWIFPGNRLFIPAIREQMISPVPTAENVRLADGTRTLNQLSEQTRRALTERQRNLVERYRYYFSAEVLNQAPFIYERRAGRSPNPSGVNNLGEVSDKSRAVLVQHRDVLVRMNESARNSKDAAVGSRLSFYVVRNDLPIARGTDGVVIELAASGVVRFVDDDYTTVFVDKVWRVAGAGARIAKPRQHQPLGSQLTYSPLSDSLETRVIARMNTDVALRQGQVVFIDKGTNGKVVIGDHFSFYERARRGSNRTRANEPIAEGLVIGTEENTATVKITSARDFSSANILIGVRQGRITAR